jgi:hypothetical protein
MSQTMTILRVSEEHMELQNPSRDVPDLRVKEMPVRARLSDASISYLFPKSKGVPCPHGLELLFAFMIERPTDFTFLEPNDFTHLHSSGFIGIPEWDDFARHYGTCKHCYG